MKKIAVFLLGMTMIVSCGMLAVGATAQEKTEKEGNELGGDPEWGYLNVVDQNIRIKALASDILEYINADSEEEEAAVLEQLLSDPNNTVSDMSSSAIMLVPETEENSIESEACLPASERKPGKWTIGSDSVIVAGGIKRYFPAGEDAIDVAYDEEVHLSYRYAGTRCVSAECSESTPSIFYDPEFWEGGFQAWWSKLPSGQYSIYIKNYSAYDLTTVSGGYFEVYEYGKK